MVSHDILLDPAIRDYALLPIFFVFLCSNLIRQNLLALIKDDPKVDMKQMKHNNVLGRARMLKSNGGRFLTEAAYKNRKAYYVKKDVGVLVKPPASKNALQQMENQDPSAAAGMLKSQMVFIVSQGALGYWVNFLFNGFLVGKTPFPLTYRFKSMLQRGVDVDNLEPGYISGLCWYFIIMMSIGSIQNFIVSLFEDDAQMVDPGGQEELMMAMGVPPGMGGPGGGMMGAPDMKKIYEQEKDSLQINLFESNMDNVEIELWKKWKRRS